MATLACCTVSESLTSPDEPNAQQGISQELALFETALQRSKKEPAAAYSLCGKLHDPQLAQDCVLAVAPQMAKANLSAAMTACKKIEPSEECFFRLAEKTKDSSLCEKAGPRETDCRLHVFSFGIKDWLPKDATGELLLNTAATHIEKAGLGKQDPRVWTALWRWRLGASKTLDRAICQPLDQIQRAQCMRAGEGLFHDRLNHFRDLGMALCQGDLPTDLPYTPDIGLNDILKERRAADLCNPSAKNRPPLQRLPGSSQ
jgi:hypothetical protein